MQSFKILPAVIASQHRCSALTQMVQHDTSG